MRGKQPRAQLQPHRNPAKMPRPPPLPCPNCLATRPLKKCQLAGMGLGSPRARTGSSCGGRRVLGPERLRSREQWAQEGARCRARGAPRLGQRLARRGWGSWGKAGRRGMREHRGARGPWLALRPCEASPWTPSEAPVSWMQRCCQEGNGRAGATRLWGGDGARGAAGAVCGGRVSRAAGGRGGGGGPRSSPAGRAGRPRAGRPSCSQAASAGAGRAKQGLLLPGEGGVSVEPRHDWAQPGGGGGAWRPRAEARELRSGRRVAGRDAGVGTEEGEQDSGAGLGSGRGQRGVQGSPRKRGAGAGGGGGRGPGRRPRLNCPWVCRGCCARG